MIMNNVLLHTYTSPNHSIHSAAPTHYPHSFPTRRSSDLTLVEIEDTTKTELTIKVTGFQWGWNYEYLDKGVTFFSRLDRKDRKSTRLNSSHRCISYAVFCLKKKNNYLEHEMNLKYNNHTM